MKIEDIPFGCFAGTILLFLAFDFGHSVKFDGLSPVMLFVFASGIGVVWGIFWFVSWRSWFQAILIAVLATLFALKGADAFNRPEVSINSSVWEPEKPGDLQMAD